MADTHENTIVEWVKERADNVKVENPYESKAWLLTGASMFPNNISMKVGQNM